MEIKVGDKVRVVWQHSNYRNLEGIVTSIDGNDYSIGVENRGFFCAPKEHIKLIEKSYYVSVFDRGDEAWIILCGTVCKVTILDECSNDRYKCRVHKNGWNEEEVILYIYRSDLLEENP